MKKRNNKAYNTFNGMIIGQFKVICNGKFVLPPSLLANFATITLMIIPALS